MGLLNNLFGSKTDFQALVNDGAIILDVRSRGEYARGHAKGAINIPVNELGGRIEELRKKDKPIITCCASGMRSGSAKSLLKSRGLEAYNGGPWQKVDGLK